MFLWNVTGLARELKANSLTSQDKYYYLLAFAIIIISITTVYRILPPACPDYYRHLIDVIGGVVYVMISLLGINACYHANHAGDDKYFIERFVCLAIPIYIRITVYFLSIAIPIGIIRAFLSLKKVWGERLPSSPTPHHGFFSDSACLANFFGMIIMAILLLGALIWIRNKLRYVSGARG